jgi:anti-anti-sigma factor
MLRIDVGTAPMNLTLHVQGRIGGGTVVVACGDLDFAAADRFRACLDRALQPPPAVLHIDLHLVTFIDSSGIGELVSAYKHAERCGTRFVLENPSGVVRSTLHTAGLFTLFGLSST